MRVTVRTRVVVLVRVQRGPGQTMLLAEGFIAAGAVAVAGAGAVFEAAADAFDVVVVRFLAQTDLDYQHIAEDLKVQALLGVPYTPDMIAHAIDDVKTQAATDAPDADALAKRYPKAQSRDFDGNPARISEADALIAYLQMLGTEVDFKLYDDKANIR